MVSICPNGRECEIVDGHLIYFVFPSSFVVLPLKSLSCCLSVLLSGCEKFIRLPEQSECNGNGQRKKPNFVHHVTSVGGITTFL